MGVRADVVFEGVGFWASRLDRASELKAHEGRLFACFVLLLMICLVVMVRLIGVKLLAVAMGVWLTSVLFVPARQG